VSLGGLKNSSDPLLVALNGTLAAAVVWYYTLLQLRNCDLQYILPWLCIINGVSSSGWLMMAVGLENDK
jgi:hypothetical protein